MTRPADALESHPSGLSKKETGQTVAKNKGITTKDIAKVAIMAALVNAATFFFKIPFAQNYTHLGDCMIFIAVLILGWQKGALAGGIGAGLADFMGGYMHWVIPTFLIKLLMGVIMGVTTEKWFSKRKHGWIGGAILGGLFQITAYTVTKIPMFGLNYALATMPRIAAQTTVGILIALAVISALMASGTIKKLKEV